MIPAQVQEVTRKNAQEGQESLWRLSEILGEVSLAADAFNAANADFLADLDASGF